MTLQKEFFSKEDIRNILSAINRANRGQGADYRDGFLTALESVALALGIRVESIFCDEPIILELTDAGR